MKKLELLHPSIIKAEPEKIKRSNAFILPSGEFYLAKGFTGCNPSHQLESSARAIARQEFDYDVKEHYKAYVKACLEEAQKNGPAKLVLNYLESAKYGIEYNWEQDEFENWIKVPTKNYKTQEILSHYYLSTILIHFYGYALFARREDIHRPTVTYECSLIPYPKFYGKEATEEQLNTLRELFALDDIFKTEEEREQAYQRVLTHYNVGRWRY